MSIRHAIATAAAFSLSGSLFAQGPAFSTPGMPGAGTPGTPSQMGQTTRFSTNFNPALGFVLDSVFDYAGYRDSVQPDGFDANLRLIEFNGAAYVDPNAWAWVALVAEESQVDVEEAAVQYIGLPKNLGLRGGRFFIDFGKQMQAHLEELRTVERPAVLRTYLGEEVAGDGLQLDQWFTAGDQTVVRYSLATFSDLVTVVEQESAGPAPVIADRKTLDSLNFTGRLTAFTDAGENGVLQAGTSAQVLPDFGFTDLDGGAADVTGLSRTVLGTDLTYGWQDAEGNRRLTVGGEYLWSMGDNGAELAGSTIDVTDETVSGYYAFADYGWSPQRSAGIQFSSLELPEQGTPRFGEIDLYYTRALSEFQRLRFQVTYGEVEGGEESIRFAVQWTAFFGNHSHGFNW